MVKISHEHLLIALIQLSTPLNHPLYLSHAKQQYNYGFNFNTILAPLVIHLMHHKLEQILAEVTHFNTQKQEICETVSKLVTHAV